MSAVVNVNVKTDQFANTIEHRLRQGPATSMELSYVLRDRFPGFTPEDAGFPALDVLIDHLVPTAIATDPQESGTVWALIDSLDHRGHSRALARMRRPAGEDLHALPAPIRRIELQAWRSILDTIAVDLTPLTILVGANATGKTSILSGLDELLSACRTANPQRVWSGERAHARVRHLLATEELPTFFRATVGARTVEARLSAEEVALVYTDADGSPSAPSAQDPAHTTGEPAPSAGAGASAPSSRPSPPSIARGLLQEATRRSWWERFADRACFLRLDTAALATPTEVLQTRLDFDGLGLPSALAHLLTTDPERVDALVEAVQRVVPQLERLRTPLVPAEGGRGPCYRLEVKLRGASWLRASQLSEGTLLAIGVHAALAGQRPSLLMLDDLDRGLHPRAQRELLAQLRTWVAQGTQVIATTHSPVLLDEVEAEEVLVVRGGPGGTRVARLSDHPEWQEWRGSMRTGEFWTWVGEDWLEPAAGAAR